MQKPRNIVDLGFGIGGSSRYLARKYGAHCQGITLSPVQANRAQEIVVAQGLDAKASQISQLLSCFTSNLIAERVRTEDNLQVSFQVADALNQPFHDEQFDLVLSMESGEHMPDKPKFVNELARVTAHGGTIMIVTWCYRDSAPSEEFLSPEEKSLLNKICGAYYLPEWCSSVAYVRLLESLSLEVLLFFLLLEVAFATGRRILIT